jgi:hypothetical protein
MRDLAFAPSLARVLSMALHRKNHLRITDYACTAGQARWQEEGSDDRGYLHLRQQHWGRIYAGSCLNTG